LLEDVKPGWRESFDVISGALTMPVTTLCATPVVCALAGAIVGGVVALRTLEVFASSATIGLTARDLANRESATAQELRVSLEKTLGPSPTGDRRIGALLRRLPLGLARFWCYGPIRCHW
jgi:hypothetical protein